MTHIYFANTGAGSGRYAFDDWDWDARPLNVLLAFPYLRSLVGGRTWKPARMMLDSGAFSAWQSGHVIDLEALVYESKNPRWTECVGLDVIGDWRGSRRNAIRMRLLGSPAMPVFHIGDPWDLLDFYCKHWPKVGLSCRFGEPIADGLRFYERCFARRWPHRFHSFGWTQYEALTLLPFDSADSTTWLRAPMFGAARIRGGHEIRVRGVSSRQLIGNLAYAIEYFLDYEAYLKQLWSADLERCAA